MSGSRRPGLTLGILTGFNVLNYLDRHVVSAVLTLIIADLHLSDRQAGSLASIFMLAYLAVSPPVGWLGDRGRRIPLCAAGVVIWSLATFGSGLAPTFAVLLLARALVGVGEGSYTVVTPSLISDLYPSERRARALAIFYAAMPVGSALGYILGGEIGHAFGWRTALFVAGGPGLLLALAFFFFSEPRRGQLDPQAREAQKLSYIAALKALRQRLSFWVNTAGQTVYTFALGGLAAWMPTYFVRERGLAVDDAGRSFGLCLVLAGFIGTLVGGYWSDRLAKRYRGAHFTFSGVSLVASLPFTFVAVLASSPAIFWPAMFVTLLLVFLNTGPLNAAVVNVLPADLRARGFAIHTLAIHLFGDAASPTLIGAASDAVGLKLPVLITGLLLGASGLVFILGRRTLVRDLEAPAL